MNVVESIYKEPEKWRQKEHTFEHENGAKIWTANIPIFNTNMYPSIYMPFSLRFKIWRAIRWWSGNSPVSAYGKT